MSIYMYIMYVYMYIYIYVFVCVCALISKENTYKRTPSRVRNGGHG